MKKSLWVTAAAMVLCWGMNVQAVTQAVFSAWSFETLTSGQAIPSAGETALDDPYGTWSASSTNGDIVIATNVTVGTLSFGYPISSGTHDRTLFFDSYGGVTNNFDIISLDRQRFYTDFLLKPCRLEDSSYLDRVVDTNTEARFAFFFDADGYFNLLHGGAVGGTWATTKFDTVVYDSNEWVRITIDQDYSASADGSRNMFSVWINATNILHPNGLSREPEEWVEDGTNDVWFYMNVSKSGSYYGMNGLVALGLGMLDDVVNTASFPFGSQESVIIVLAISTNESYGAISPAGGEIAITSGVPRLFTLTVADGVAGYVSGLMINDVQVETNLDQNVKTQYWNVAYEQVAANGTNVIALFAAKSSTTADWLDNYFTIKPSGGDYTSFALAAAGDWDGDGFSNLQESIAGTDPKDNTSYLRISSIVKSPSGDVSVSFQGSALGAPGPYNLMAADVVTGPYSNITTRAKEDGLLGVTNAPPASVSNKFYKVAIPYSGE